ncbi:hypothetical protein AMATHDRAFT_166031, partial [Amanita thiersii Skay4041]
QQSIHKACQSYYRETIQEALNSRKPWKLLKWGNVRPPPAFSMIKLANGKQVSSLPELWSCLHNQFNSSSAITPALEEINTYQQFPHRLFNPISKMEIHKALVKTKNGSAPGPDHLTWHHLKFLWNSHECFQHQLHQSLAWSGVTFWPLQFKASTTLVIPKPNKSNYSTPKAYRPICLLNTISKLTTKVLVECMNMEAILH